MAETAAEKKARLERELKDAESGEERRESIAERNVRLTDEDRAKRQEAMKGELDRELERRTSHPRHDALGDHDPDEKHTPLHKKLRRQWPTVEGIEAR